LDAVEELFKSHGRVETLQFDEEFLQHLSERATYQKHEVSVTEILEVHNDEPKFFLNTGSGRAPVIMVGMTMRGRYLVVPTEPTGQVGTWRPVTAFEANRHHKERYRGRQQ
jgi:hypothetical protein